MTNSYPLRSSSKRHAKTSALTDEKEGSNTLVSETWPNQNGVVQPSRKPLAWDTLNFSRRSVPFGHKPCLLYASLTQLVSFIIETVSFSASMMKSAVAFTTLTTKNTPRLVICCKRLHTPRIYDLDGKFQASLTCCVTFFEDPDLDPTGLPRDRYWRGGPDKYHKIAIKRSPQFSAVLIYRRSSKRLPLFSAGLVNLYFCKTIFFFSRRLFSNIAEMCCVPFLQFQLYKLP